jgi:hypothetical protein
MQIWLTPWRLSCPLDLAKVKIRVTLRLAIYRQSVRLGAKPLEDHDQIFFPQLNPCGHSPYLTSSLTRRWVCRLIYKSSVSTGFTEQIMPILRILCYNGSLVTWTVVSLTISKFKHLIFFDAINIYAEREVKIQAFLWSELVQAVTILICIW